MVTILPLVGAVRWADDDGMAYVHVCPWHRVAARVGGAGLDDRLAAGRSSEASPRLQARADLLLAPRARRALARSWSQLADRALDRRSALMDPRTPIASGSILAASEEIGELIHVLSADPPVDVRLVALARCLLVDGGSPVYAAGGDLAQALRDALSLGEPPFRPARTSLHRAG